MKHTLAKSLAGKIILWKNWCSAGVYCCSKQFTLYDDGLFWSCLCFYM